MTKERSVNRRINITHNPKGSVERNHYAVGKMIETTTSYISRTKRAQVRVSTSQQQSMWCRPIIHANKVKDLKLFDKHGGKMQRYCHGFFFFNESRCQDGSENFRVAQQSQHCTSAEPKIKFRMRNQHRRAERIISLFPPNRTQRHLLGQIDVWCCHCNTRVF